MELRQQRTELRRRRCQSLSGKPWNGRNLEVRKSFRDFLAFEGFVSDSRTSEEIGFQRSLTDKFSGLLKSRQNPKLKNYNDSNFSAFDNFPFIAIHFLITEQYWMPDSTGRECYQCEERFTTFRWEFLKVSSLAHTHQQISKISFCRRRHHCRLCGQIFCAKCCSSRIDGASLGYMGELRLCDWCAKKVQRLSEEGKQNPTRSQTPVNNRKISFDRSNSHKTSDTVRTVSNGKYLPPSTHL